LINGDYTEQPVAAMVNAGCAPCIFAVICFLLPDNYVLVALAVLLIVLFAMMSPTKLKIVFQLQLTEEEIVEL